MKGVMRQRSGARQSSRPARGKRPSPLLNASATTDERRRKKSKHRARSTHPREPKAAGQRRLRDPAKNRDSAPIVGPDKAHLYAQQSGQIRPYAERILRGPSPGPKGLTAPCKTGSLGHVTAAGAIAALPLAERDLMQQLEALAKSGGVEFFERGARRQIGVE